MMKVKKKNSLPGSLQEVPLESHTQLPSGSHSGFVKGFAPIKTSQWSPCHPILQVQVVEDAKDLIPGKQKALKRVERNLKCVVFLLTIRVTSTVSPARIIGRTNLFRTIDACVTFFTFALLRRQVACPMERAKDATS